MRVERVIVSNGETANFENLHTEVDVSGALSGAYRVFNRKTGDTIISIPIQNGTVLNKGVNGVSVEDILFIAIQELESHAAGPFPCKETSEALAHSHQALGWLISRTRNRIARQVEGKELK